MDDLQGLAQGANAIKAVFDGLRSAIALLKDLRAAGGGSREQQQFVDKALDEASKAAAIAEAQVAKALGYELCHCTFPPVTMLTVGHIERHTPRLFGPVFECPRCGINTAGPYGYKRIAPPRAPVPEG